MFKTKNKESASTFMFETKKEDATTIMFETKKESATTIMFKTKMKEGASILFPLSYKSKMIFCQLYTKKSDNITSLTQICELTGLHRYKARRGFNELRAAGLCDRKIYNDAKGYRRSIYFIPEENCTKEIFDAFKRDLEEAAAESKKNCTKAQSREKSSTKPLCNFGAIKNTFKKVAGVSNKNCTKAQSRINTGRNLCAVGKNKPAYSYINNNNNINNNIYINTANAAKAADKPQEKKTKRSKKKKYDFRREDLNKIMNHYGIIYPEAKKAFLDFLEVRDSIKPINTEPTVKWLAKCLKRLANSAKEQIIVLEYAITKQSVNLFVPPASYYNPTWHFYTKKKSNEADFEQNSYDWDDLEKALTAN